MSKNIASINEFTLVIRLPAVELNKTSWTAPIPQKKGKIINRFFVIQKNATYINPTKNSLINSGWKPT